MGPSGSPLPGDTPPAISHHARYAQHALQGVDRPSFPLLSIFFAEFDNTVGPKITCQAPQGFLSDELFESISDFMITSTSLCHKLVTVAAFQYTIIGYPMSLSHKKYHRNALLFNVAFVFPRDVNAAASTTAGGMTASMPGTGTGTQEGESQSGGLQAGQAGAGTIPPVSSTSSSQSTATQLRPYHAVIRKLATIIESLEVESEFLFRPQSKRLLQGLVEKVFRSLNSYGECAVLLEADVKEHVREHVLPHMHAASALSHAHTAAGHSKSATATAASSGGGGGVDDGSALVSTPLGLHSGGGGGGGDSGSGDIGRSLGVHKINLKLYPQLALPPKHVPAWLVPLPVKDLEARWKSEWDLTLRQVIPFLDGVNYLSRVALLSGIHLSLVTKCVRQLLYYEAVQLVDIFQFSNRYAPTEQLGRTCSSVTQGQDEELLARNRTLRSDMRRVARFDRRFPKPPFCALFAILGALGPNVSCGEVFRNLDKIVPRKTTNATTTTTMDSEASSGAPAPPPPPSPVMLESLNIHPRKFIQFALINGLIRRVYLYPLLLPSGMGGAGSGLAGGIVGAGMMHSPSLGALNGMAHGASPALGPMASASGASASSLMRESSSSAAAAASSSSGLPSSSATSTSALTDLSFLGLLHGRQQQLEDALARHVAAQKLRQSVRSLVPIPLPQQQLPDREAQQGRHKGMFRTQSARDTHAAGNGNAHDQGDEAPSGSAGGGGLHGSSSSTSSSLHAHVAGSGSSSGAPSTGVSFRALERYLDGEHHFDALCCMFGRSFAALEEEVRRSKRCIVMAK